MTFITDDIISENGLTATTATINTINSTILSATTLYGNGNNLSNVTVTAGGPNFSVQYNNNGAISGTSFFLYSADTLFFTGTTRLNGLFYRRNSPSTKLVHQWGGSIAVGATPGIIWTNMPGGTTTWLHSTTGSLTNDATYVTDLTEYSECRLFTSLQAVASSAATLTVQYATSIGGAYSPLISIPLSGGTGVKDSNWSGITSAANTLVYIRLVGAGGNAIDDPRFSPPILLIR